MGVTDEMLKQEKAGAVVPDDVIRGSIAIGCEEDSCVVKGNAEQSNGG